MALVISGDLYDGDLRSMKTAAFLGRQMRRLDDTSVRVFMVRGNHDSESTVTRYLDLPENVHVFTGHGGVVQLPEKGGRDPWCGFRAAACTQEPASQVPCARRRIGQYRNTAYEPGRRLRS